MIRIHDIESWRALGGKAKLPLPGTRPRRIRLEVNAPDFVRLHLVDAHGEIRFLALVRGRDTIEFSIATTTAVMADGECYVMTADGDAIHQTVEAPQTFTKIMERRPRNHDLERVLHESQANTRRLLEQQAAHFQSMLERGLASRAPEPAPAPAPVVAPVPTIDTIPVAGSAAAPS